MNSPADVKGNIAGSKRASILQPMLKEEVVPQKCSVIASFRIMTV
jgi:hypothetical protein